MFTGSQLMGRFWAALRLQAMEGAAALSPNEASSIMGDPVLIALKKTIR